MRETPTRKCNFNCSIHYMPECDQHISCLICLSFLCKNCQNQKDCKEMEEKI